MNIFEIEVHPAADIFPMIPKDELEELAADIKANGLIHPIVVKENVLIDGRNRRAACKIAGVEPEVEELNGEDIGAYIISANVMHRRLTKGQQAMSVAMVHRVAYSADDVTKLVTNVHHGRLHESRLILDHSMENSREVMAGTMPFDTALKAAKDAIALTNKRAAQMSYLEENHPNIIALITDGDLSLEEGWAVKKERDTYTEAIVSGMNGAMKRVTQLERLFQTDIIAVKHANALKEYGVFFENTEAADVQALVKITKNLSAKLNYFVEELT